MCHELNIVQVNNWILKTCWIWSSCKAAISGPNHACRPIFYATKILASSSNVWPAESTQHGVALSWANRGSGAANRGKMEPDPQHLSFSMFRSNQHVFWPVPHLNMLIFSLQFEILCCICHGIWSGQRWNIPSFHKSLFTKWQRNLHSWVDTIS